jgi:hypothetical protein
MFAASNSSSIASYAFEGCAALHEIYIPNGATANLSSGTADAFIGCTATGAKIYYYGDNSTIASDFKNKFDALKVTDN